jgi:SRSO17 transposase
MMIPITEIPPSIADGLRPYRDLFPRVETFNHLMEYATGLVVLDKPSILRLSECLVDDVDQSCINKMITQSPWDGKAVNQRRLELISPQYKGKGLIVGIIDTTLLHHPRSKNIYAADKYWDYVNNCYTTGIQVVTSAISCNDRCDGFDYRIYHRFHQQAEEAYLQYASKFTHNQPQMMNFLTSLLAHIENKQNHQTKHQLAVEMVEQMEKSELAPGVYVVDSSLFAPVLIDKIDTSFAHTTKVL